MQKPRVLVIGAGASGIAATARLLENGFDNILILEAEDRIGGRIHSVNFAGTVVDLGAQWCHGEEDNVVYKHAKDLDVLSPSYNSYDDFAFYESTGRALPKDLTDKLLEIAFEISYDDGALVDFNGSFGDYFEKRFKKQVNEQIKDADPNLIDEITKWYHNLILCLDAAPTWYDISAKGLVHYKECEGDMYLHWRDSGYKTILDILMKKIPDPSKQLPIDDKILLKKEVMKIKWDLNFVNVECSDGSSYSADHVIITLPLGVLKQTYSSLFSPELPLNKQNVINGLGFGSIKKIILEFPEQWWPEDCKGFNLTWTNEDREEATRHFPCKDGTSWLEDVFGFHIIDNHPRILLCWIVGSHAIEVESFPNDAILDGCMFLLRKFFGNLYNIVTPSNIICSSWSTNPHFCGTYSYRSNKTEDMNVSAKNLSEPITVNNKSILLFAGEATHSYYYSTVHGAIESGFREADRLIDMYNNTSEVKKTKVVIVGAGISGLGAADTFVNAGFEDFLILEAQEEIGGRIKTVETDFGCFDLGAQWIHGTENPVYNTAKKNDLLSMVPSEEGLGMYIRNDGFIFEEDLVKLFDFEFGKVLEECEEFVDSIEYPNSIGDYLEQRFLKYENCWDTVSDMKSELLDWHIRFQLIDNSCLNLKNLSARDWGKYSCPGSDGQAHINLIKGYKSIVSAIVNKIPKDKLKCNLPVTKIDWKNKSDKIRINCSNRMSVCCDHVIVTASLGVLKHCASTLFQPSLPKQLRTTIEYMGFCGGIGKIFLVFEKKWWKTEGFQLLWKKGVIMNGVESWTRHISGFDLIFNHSNVLLGWVGNEGVTIMEDLSEEEVGIHCVDLLRSFLKDDDIPYPIKVIRSTWTSNPWIRGGYSYTTTQCDELNLGPSNLCKPVFDNGIPRVLLAGEACHSNHFSTTHGAFESGQNQANLILDFYK